MAVKIEDRVENNRLGLSLAALFGWLLSFPLFGRLLSDTAGDSTLALGLSFIISHAVGLLLLHLAPVRATAEGRTAWAAGSVIAGFTVVYALLSRILIVDILLLAALGLASAYFILAWASRFAGHDRPFAVLAAAMAGANLVYAGINMPLPLPVKPFLILLAALAYGGVLLFQAESLAGMPEKVQRQGLPEATKAVKPLAAFIVAVYFIGGIWYHFFALELTAAPHWQATINSLIYSGGIVFLACLARRGQPGNLATYSLSALGIGLLIALTDSGRSVVVLSYKAALNLGFAAADLFLWYALWMLARHFKSRRVFGLGLGFSVMMIALSVILCNLGVPGKTPALHYTAALTLLFFLVPVVFNNPFQPFNPQPDNAAKTTAGAAGMFTPPDRLTPMESRIYTLLLQGADDAQIAERLYISRHTVKFHVRNILHKAEAKNRRELLSRHLSKMV
jgi:DNA-binding CsgD family transcriptional regulator